MCQQRDPPPLNPSLLAPRLLTCGSTVIVPLTFAGVALDPAVTAATYSWGNVAPSPVRKDSGVVGRVVRAIVVGGRVWKFTVLA